MASFAHILNLYLGKVPHDIAPYRTAVLTPGDYQLYLFAYEQQLFVLVEADHPPLKTLPKDIEDNLPVIIQGWKVLKQKQDEADTDRLPRTCFSSDTANETDENWRNFAYTFHYESGFYYALLRATNEITTNTKT